MRSVTPSLGRAAARDSPKTPHRFNPRLPIGLSAPPGPRAPCGVARKQWRALRPQGGAGGGRKRRPAPAVRGLRPPLGHRSATGHAGTTSSAFCGKAARRDPPQILKHGRTYCCIEELSFGPARRRSSPPSKGLEKRGGKNHGKEAGVTS